MRPLYIKQDFIVILISFTTLLLAMLPGGLAFLSYIFLSLCLIFNYNLAPFIFLNLCFLVLGNEALFIGLENYGIFKYLIILIFIVQSFAFFPKKIISNFYFFYFFLIFIVITLHSVFFSIYPLFSFLKILFWFLFVFSFLVFFYRQHNDNKKKILKLCYSILLIGVVASLFLNFIPSIGYFLNGTGLQGIYNQPQVFGSISGIFGLISIILFFNSKNYLYLFFLLLSVVSIYLSQARTAALALGLASTFLVLQIFFDRVFSNTNKMYSRFSLRFLFILIITLPLIIMWKLQEILNFINKRGEDGFSNISESSRAVLIQPMFENIKNYGFTGIGFGIPSDLNFSDMIYLPIIYLPISLPIEKGVFYIATIEEMGFLFGIIVYLLLFKIFKKHLLINWYSPIIVFIFAINLAENTFFSIGGLGMLFWVFACMSLSFFSSSK